MPSGLDSTDWSDERIGQMPLCLLLSVPPPCVHTLRFTDARNIQHTPLQKYGVAGEDIHLVTMAEKMQPALLVTAHPAKKVRKRKPEAEKAATKKALDKERSRTKSTLVRCLSG